MSEHEHVWVDTEVSCPEDWPCQDGHLGLRCDCGKVVDLAYEDNPLEQPSLCPDCGREDGSFACKIRHIQVNTGWAKSAND